MKTHTIRPRTLAALRAAFTRYRSSLHVAGSVALSVSTVKIADHLDRTDTARRVASLVTQTAREMDQETRDERDTGETLSPALATLAAEVDSDTGESSSLNGAQRRQIAHERPGSRSVVFRSVAVAEVDALPEGVSPAPFIPYVSEIVSLDAETNEQIERESQAEIADALATLEREQDAAVSAARATAFRSGFSGPWPVDYSPDGTRGKITAKIARVVAPRTHNRRMSDAGFAAFASGVLATANA